MGGFPLGFPCTHPHTHSLFCFRACQFLSATLTMHLCSRLAFSSQAWMIPPKHMAHPKVLECYCGWTKSTALNTGTNDFPWCRSGAKWISSIHSSWGCAFLFLGPVPLWGVVYGTTKRHMFCLGGGQDSSGGIHRRAPKLAWMNRTRMGTGR